MESDQIGTIPSPVLPSSDSQSKGVEIPPPVPIVRSAQFEDMDVVTSPHNFPTLAPIHAHVSPYEGQQQQQLLPTQQLQSQAIPTSTLLPPAHSLASVPSPGHLLLPQQQPINPAPQTAQMYPSAFQYQYYEPNPYYQPMVMQPPPPGYGNYMYSGYPQQNTLLMQDYGKDHSEAGVIDRSFEEKWEKMKKRQLSEREAREGHVERTRQEIIFPEDDEREKYIGKRKRVSKYSDGGVPKRRRMNTRAKSYVVSNNGYDEDGDFRLDDFEIEESYEESEMDVPVVKKKKKRKKRKIVEKQEPVVVHEERSKTTNALVQTALFVCDAREFLQRELFERIDRFEERKGDGKKTKMTTVQRLFNRDPVALIANRNLGTALKTMCVHPHGRGVSEFTKPKRLTSQRRSRSKNGYNGSENEKSSTWEKDRVEEWVEKKLLKGHGCDGFEMVSMLNINNVQLGDNKKKKIEVKKRRSATKKFIKDKVIGTTSITANKSSMGDLHDPFFTELQVDLDIDVADPKEGAKMIDYSENKSINRYRFETSFLKLSTTEKDDDIINVFSDSRGRFFPPTTINSEKLNRLKTKREKQGFRNR